MAKQKQPPKERTPEEQKAYEKKQKIWIVVIMIVILVGTSIHYYIFSKNHAEQGKDVGPTSGGPTNLVEAIAGPRPDVAPATQPADVPATQPADGM